METEAPALIFFEGESEAVLKEQFIELSAKHFTGGWSAYDIAKYVFRDLKDPDFRAMQAANYWMKDLGVVDEIKRRHLLGPNSPEISKEGLQRRLLSIADNTLENARDRIAALRTIAEMEGLVIKAVDKKVQYPNGQKPATAFVFKIDPDAGKPPEIEAEDA